MSLLISLTKLRQKKHPVWEDATRINDLKQLLHLITKNLNNLQYWILTSLHFFTYYFVQFSFFSWLLYVHQKFKRHCEEHSDVASTYFNQLGVILCRTIKKYSILQMIFFLRQYLVKNPFKPNRHCEPKAWQSR